MKTNTNLRQISIDLEVHKAIEGERKSLDESEHQILRRLLGIDMPVPTEPATNTIGGEPWQRRGLVLSNGTDWRIVYGNKEFKGIIVDGRFRFGTRSFKSPSGLTIALCRTAKGERTSLNGWRYVEIFQPSRNRWFKLQDLLDEARK
jgi:hypothetical protein